MNLLLRISKKLQRISRGLLFRTKVCLPLFLYAAQSSRSIGEFFLTCKKISKLFFVRKFELRNVCFQVFGPDLLRIISNSFSAAGIKPIALWGTLLGVVRENAFLKYDIDIDLAILQSNIQQFEKVKTHLEEQGCKIKNNNDHKFSFYHPQIKRLWADVDVIYIKDSVAQITTPFIESNIEYSHSFPAKIFEEFEEIEIYESTLLKPKRAEDFLSAVYGNWKVPKRDYDYRFSPKTSSVRLLNKKLSDPSAPDVSIIVPMYNAEKTIGRCLASLLEQQFWNIEIVCVNDASTDNCVKIVEQAASKDSRIRLVHHKNNKGLNETRNSGVENSRGFYVTIVDADDYIQNSLVADLIELAEIHQADIVQTNTCYLDSNDKIERVNSTGTEVATFSPSFPYERFGRYDGAPGLSHRCTGKLFRKNFLSENKLCFNTEKRWVSGDDSIFMQLVAIHASSVVCSPRADYFYCWNESGLTKSPRNKLDMIRDNIITISRMIRVMQEQSLAFSKENTTQLASSFNYLIDIRIPTGIAEEQDVLSEAYCTCEEVCQQETQLLSIVFPDWKQRVVAAKNKNLR